MVMNFEKLLKIEKYKVYHWDVGNNLRGVHEGTKTVVVKNILTGSINGPMARVESLETGEVFVCSVKHLQPDPEFLKEKYISLLKRWKIFGFKPRQLYEIHDEFLRFHREKILKYVIIVDSKSLFWVTVIDSCGHVWTCNRYFIKDLDSDRRFFGRREKIPSDLANFLFDSEKPVNEGLIF
jgi:hypothetical protein